MGTLIIKVCRVALPRVPFLKGWLEEPGYVEEARGEHTPPLVRHPSEEGTAAASHGILHCMIVVYMWSRAARPLFKGVARRAGVCRKE